MKWLRLYNETVNDPKWRMIAIETEQPVHAVLAVWMAMLCHASGAEPRGTLTGWNDRLTGAALDLKGAAVEAIRTAMAGVVLDGDRLSAWDKRQFKTDDVNERSKRHRAKKPAHERDGNVAETDGDPTRDGHATLHDPDATLPPLRATDLRLQNTEDLPADDARASVTVVGREVLRLIGVENDPRWFGNWGRVAQWLADGADPDTDIYPAIQRVMSRRRAQGPPRGLEYFDQAIADALATRNRPMPEGTPHEQRRGIQSVRPSAPANRFQRILDRDLAGCAEDA
ncbi:hypothetical protein [Azospirillum lipoferum]|uniref:DUF1376 domain-containing protein n=1 Tax=Azospirillum lipoferum (strain 4B) TaxID=862719 RepID=G7ZAT7_AZOL4|nr:hypothetical protein [Azospirillum lipoferum]CBS88997.1 protein of unknown function [Azospirillum lipoferum 4B]